MNCRDLKLEPCLGCRRLEWAQCWVVHYRSIMSDMKRAAIIRFIVGHYDNTLIPLRDCIPYVIAAAKLCEQTKDIKDWEKYLVLV